MTLVELANEITDLLNRHEGQIDCISALAALGLASSRVLAQLPEMERVYHAAGFAETLLQVASIKEGASNEHIRQH